MSTSIEWTHAPGFKGESWNPVRGCVKISPGCKNCYASTFAERWRGVPGHAYEQGFDLRLVGSNLDHPVRWSRQRRMIFVGSMTDVFQKGVEFEFVDRIFGTMWACEYMGAQAYDGHIFQMLTKRPENMLEYLSTDRRLAWANAAVRVGGGENPDPLHDQVRFAEYVHPRIWMGTSVEDKRHGLPRIDVLRQVPAAVRFLSIEPLLEDLGEIDLTGIHWVLVGGESGHDARPCAVEWIERIVAQCRRAGVPVFVKQLGAYVVSEERMLDGNWAWRAGLADRKGGDMDEWWSDQLRVREWPAVLAAA